MTNEEIEKEITTACKVVRGKGIALRRGRFASFSGTTVTHCCALTALDMVRNNFDAFRAASSGLIWKAAAASFGWKHDDAWSFMAGFDNAKIDECGLASPNQELYEMGRRVADNVLS